MDNTFAYKCLLIAILILIISYSLKKLMVITPPASPQTISRPAPVPARTPLQEKPIEKTAELPVLPDKQAVLPVETTSKKMEASPLPDKHPPAQGIQSKYTWEWKGTYGGIPDKVFTIIRDQNTWDRLWSRFTLHRPYKILTPKVDFSKNMVVVLIMGEQPDSGYRIGIGSVKKEGDSTVITYYQAQPADAPGQPPVIPSQPYHIKVLPVLPAPYVFKRAAP